MTHLQEYALIKNNQITPTEWFKRPELVPKGDWRLINEITPDYDPATHHLGEKVLQILPDETVAYVWTVVENPPPPVPQQIQMWQARAILSRVGLLGSVDQAVKAATNPEIEIAWEYAPSVLRNSAFVTDMARALGLNDVTVDNLFIEGSKIK